jgi:hypothetical protein
VHGLVDRVVRERGDEIAGHHDFLAADAVRQRAEHDEERCAEGQGDGDDDVRLHEVDLEHVLQEDQRVELSRVPDHRLPRRGAEQHEQDDLPVLPVAE